MGLYILGMKRGSKYLQNERDKNDFYLIESPWYIRVANFDLGLLETKAVVMARGVSLELNSNLYLGLYMSSLTILVRLLFTSHTRIPIEIIKCSCLFQYYSVK